MRCRAHRMATSWPASPHTDRPRVICAPLLRFEASPGSASRWQAWRPWVWPATAEAAATPFGMALGSSWNVGSRLLPCARPRRCGGRYSLRGCGSSAASKSASALADAPEGSEETGKDTNFDCLPGSARRSRRWLDGGVLDPTDPDTARGRTGPGASAWTTGNSGPGASCLPNVARRPKREAPRGHPGSRRGRGRRPRRSETAPEWSSADTRGTGPTRTPTRPGTGTAVSSPRGPRRRGS